MNTAHQLSEIEYDSAARMHTAYCVDCYDPDYSEGSYTGYHIYEGTPTQIMEDHLDHIYEEEEEYNE